jgi:hypothetical protein
MGLESIQPKEKMIGENTYQVRLLPSELGFRSAAKLANLIGPGLKTLQEGGAESVTGFFGGMLADELLTTRLEFFTNLFKEYTSVRLKGAPGFVNLSSVYEYHFSGNYLEMFQWLAFCIEVNHASFFTGVGLNTQKLVRLLEEALRSKYPSRAGRPGQSGDSFSPENSTRPTPA